MATLKINSIETRWLTNVTELIRLGEFTVPKTGNGPGEEDRVFAAANAVGLLGRGMPVHCVVFEDLETADMQGVALLVKRDGRKEDKVWLIPCRSAFLMSDSGSTIDRI